MTIRKRRVEAIPEEFDSYEQAAEFWGKHDTMDYPEAFETVNAKTELRGRHYEVEVDESTMLTLRKRARRRGISVRELISDLAQKQT